MTELKYTKEDKIIIFNRFERVLKETDAIISIGNLRLFWDGSQWCVRNREKYQKNERGLYTGADLWDALNIFRAEL